MVKAIQNLSNHRRKYSILFQWKKEFLINQYADLRKQQSITSIVKVMEGVQSCLVYSSFNVLKSWNVRIKEAGLKLKGAMDEFNWKQYKKAFNTILIHAK